MSRRTPPPTVVHLVTSGALLLFSAYWLIFAVTTDDGFIRSGLSAFNNTAPAIALAIVTHLFLDNLVWRKSLLIRIVAQVPLAILFALAWYLAILVIRELRGGWLENGFSTTAFVPVAFAWQMFQGVTFYALVALASLVILLNRRLAALEEAAPRGSRSHRLSRLLVKTRDETETVDIEQIVAISGAGDYSELVLSDRSLLSTTSLAEFEARLPDDQFIRAHRSHLVRVGAITRTEPAGNGRTVIHLCNGTHITTSRAGTRQVREAAM